MEHRLFSHTNQPDPPPQPPRSGHCDKNAIRAGALELVVARQRATIRAQRDEIERLGHCIKELEREAMAHPHQGFSSYDAFASAREYSESPHSDHQDGRLNNTTGKFVHLA